MEDAAANGRWLPHLMRRVGLQNELRTHYADVLGCEPSDVALTTSTTEGLAKVIGGMGLREGDEVLTAEDEHPGLLGPLIAVRRRGVRVRTAPLHRIAEAVGPGTTAVACSHIGWMTGDVVDPAVAELDIPVILDGAQGAGAVPVDVGALGCDVYSASGQKWMCGADGTGMLYVSTELCTQVESVGPHFLSFVDPTLGLDAVLHEDARRHDTPAIPREGVAQSLAAASVLADAGWDWVHERGIGLAARLADRLTERGRTVAPRGATTLVSFEVPEPEATSRRLNAEGITIRDIPGTPYLRASVGAWNDEGDLDRLLELLGSG